MPNLRIYGTVPNSNSGIYNIKLRCDDIMSQQVHQTFSYEFKSNNDPVQAITDLSTLTILVGEGRTYNYTLPSGIWTDPDGDRIYYQFMFFGNNSLVDNSWAKFYEDFEGDSIIEFMNVPATAQTNTVFKIMANDDIGTSKGPLSIPTQFNFRPTLSIPTLGITAYPASNFSVDVDLSTFFTDPDGDTLTFTFTGLPVGFSATLVSGTTYKIAGDSTSFSGTTNFNIQADDTFSLPTDLPSSISGVP